VVGATLVTAAALVVTRGAVGPDPGRLAFVGINGRALLCLTVAFAADDPATAAAPAVPVSTRTRLVSRLAPLVLMTAGAWLALCRLEDRLAGPTGARDDLTGDALAGVALAAVALAAAALAARRSPRFSPGAVGAGCAATLTALATLVPADWAHHGPDASYAWPLVAAVGLAGAWRATSEPAP
jgi:hypothetical protein